MVKLLFPQPVTTFHFLPSFPGTPTEDTWPGITSNEEFRAYNFTQYRAQPLINHAPRYPPSPQHRSGGIGQPGTAPKWEPGALGSSAGCDAERSCVGEVPVLRTPLPFVDDCNGPQVS